MRSISLVGKVAWITGASGGIGSAIARTLADAGCSLVLCGRNKEKLDALAKELRTFSRQEISTASFDLGKTEDCLAALAEHKIFQEKANFLINAAGLGLRMTAFQETPLEEMEKVIKVNLMGFLNITRLLLPSLIENQNGHVVNIGSVGGKLPSPKNVAYNATKSAMLAATESLRIDLMGQGVRVTVIEPGLVETEMSQASRFENKAQAEVLYRGMELLQPEDVADSVHWALTRPPRVNVQEIVVYPTDQASVGYMNRGKKIKN